MNSDVVTMDDRIICRVSSRDLVLYFLQAFGCLALPAVAAPVDSQTEGQNFHLKDPKGLKVKKGFKYNLKTAAFSDYASKLRSIYLPPDTLPKIDSGYIKYPNGTFIVKSFYYYSLPKLGCYSSNGELQGLKLDQRYEPTLPATGTEICLVETRILEKSDDAWLPHTYLWSKDQNNTSSAPYGAEQAITLHSELKSSFSFNYHVPDTNECRQCHQGASSHSLDFEPIGPTRLDRIDFQNSEFPAEFTVKAKTYLERHNSGQVHANTVTQKARDYLDINCAHCHNKNGVAASSAMFLERDENNLNRLGFCKLPVAIGGDVSNLLYDIYPSHPEKSILIKRLESLDAKVKMPELSKSVIDPVGTRVVSDWIRQLKGECKNDVVH